MSFEEPTERLQRPKPSQPPMPGPLDVTRHDSAEPTPDPDPTDVLSLDELLGPHGPAHDAASEAAGPSEAGEPPAAGTPLPSADEPDAEAPLVADRSARTPMPVAPVRSGSGADRADVGVARFAGGTAVLRGGATRVAGWLRRDDNALTLVTAVVAIVLLSVVAAFGA